MAEKDTKKVIRELQQRINRYIRLTLKDIKTEAKEEFDRNFQREAFFTEKWKRRRYAQDETRGILQQSGTLRKKHTGRDHGRQQGSSIYFIRSLCQDTQRRWNHYRYPKDERIFLDQVQGSYGQNGIYPERELRRTRKNRQLSSDAEFYRAMALKKVGSKIVIPRRQFIGTHPDLEKLLQEIARKNIKEVFND